MTVRTQAVPDLGAKTPLPALEPLLLAPARPGRPGRHVRSSETADIPAAFRRTTPLGLPELTEPQVVRHYTHLAQLNYAVDTGMYPLGSCTMKYNPKVNDRVAGLFADIHPRQSYRTSQASCSRTRTPSASSKSACARSAPRYTTSAGSCTATART